MKEKESYLLITRFLSQQTTTEENEYLTDWIASSPANEQMFYEIKAVWRASKPSHHLQSKQALEKLRSKMKQEVPGKTIKSSLYPKWFSIAAAMICMLSISGAAYQYYHKDQDSLNYMQEKTSAGQKKIIHLEDGTTVYLAPQSTLIYPVQSSLSQRNVELKGEAYFEVSKNPHRPFIVHTKELDVQVLGTHFNVKSYKSNNTTTVSLLEGSVKVRLADKDQNNAQDDYILKPGQELSLNHLSHRVYQYKLDSLSATGWMTNTLVFKNERLADAAEKLEKIYGIKIVFADQETAETRVYASFENESLINVLKTIKAAGNVTYSISGNKVYLALE